MSYDVYLMKGMQVAELPKSVEQPHGGTYSPESRDAWLNITWNYSRFFYEFLDKELGIRWLYGKKARETISRLEETIEELDPATATSYYWDPTPGNARKALEGLLRMAKALPDCEWKGD